MVFAYLTKQVATCQPVISVLPKALLDAKLSQVLKPNINFFE